MQSILEFLRKLSASEPETTRLAEKTVTKLLALEKKVLLLNRQNKTLAAKNKSISEKNAYLIQQAKLLREEMDARCAEKPNEKVLLDEQEREILRLVAKKTIITDHELAETLKENITNIQAHLAKLFHNGLIHASIHVRHMFQQRIPDQFSITNEGKEYLKTHC